MKLERFLLLLYFLLIIILLLLLLFLFLPFSRLFERGSLNRRQRGKDLSREINRVNCTWKEYKLLWFSLVTGGTPRAATFLNVQ